MGFYYGSGQPGDGDGEQGGWRETFVIIGAVFRALALPMAILFGVLGYFVLTIYLFTVHPLAGLGCLAAVVLILVARGIWEARHPPDLTKL